MRSPTAGILTSRLQRKLAEWANENRGQTAVEFALIAAPFFFIIFGLMEICLIFIMSTVLEHAVSDSSREIRTGQAQEAGPAQRLGELAEVNRRALVAFAPEGEHRVGAALDRAVDHPSQMDTEKRKRRIGYGVDQMTDDLIMAL